MLLTNQPDYRINGPRDRGGSRRPGDVGILTPGEGITVYPIFARALQAFDDQPDRWVDLTWDTNKNP